MFQSTRPCERDGIDLAQESFNPSSVCPSNPYISKMNSPVSMGVDLHRNEVTSKVYQIGPGRNLRLKPQC